jgi:hypothetical protein
MNQFQSLTADLYIGFLTILTIFVKQLPKAWLFECTMVAANLWPFHVNQMLATESFDFHVPIHSQNSFPDDAFQYQIRAAVGTKYCWNRTIETVLRFPFSGMWITLNQPALLFRVSSIEILIIKTTLIAGWCDHSLSNIV